jgi:hypothetical protein
MKRLILLVLVLTMAVSPALAAGIDLSEMTDAELVELRAQIDEILNDNGSKIYEGTYVTGTDIKPGRYELTCYQSTLTLMNVMLYADNTQDNMLEDYHLTIGSSVYVNLSEGMVLTLKLGSCYIKTASADWAP